MGTPHLDPVTGLADGCCAAEAWTGLDDGKPCGTEGMRTTRLSEVQQSDAEWPFVKLSATRSDCSPTVADWVEVSATQSWKAAGEVVESRRTNASFLPSADQAGVVVHRPFGMAATSVAVAGLEMSTS